MKTTLLALSMSLASSVFAGPPVTFDSLLSEMSNRPSVAAWPANPYTCKQFSSYDRASTGPDKPDTWFANNDAGQYLRVEENKDFGGRKEFVMADTDGPGAVVRVWSPNPKGVIRFYLDGAKEPAIEAPFVDLLSGKAAINGVKIQEPLSSNRSMGWNLYLPIPYAKHCKITHTEGGSYYQVNYRTYAPGTVVEPLHLGPQSQATSAALMLKWIELTAFGETKDLQNIKADGELKANGHVGLNLPSGPGSVARIRLNVASSPLKMQEVLRSLVVVAEFDGEKCTWAPASDFFGSGVGANTFQDFYRHVGPETLGVVWEIPSKVEASQTAGLECWWAMPYKTGGTVTLLNLGAENVKVALSVDAIATPWTDNSMHFHAGWIMESPIHTKKGTGTKDFNYLQVQGQGIYVGDTLAVVNPVPDWWGEGDEKIYTDGEKFPSHFGTGTEDYYGYGWCCPVVFNMPFQSQVRCDGNGKNNWGHTTVSRVRSLDAIPFTRDFKFDMEVWHWAECDVHYAVTTYWYAKPGAKDNRGGAAHEAAMTAILKKGIPVPTPLPPPYKIAGALECEEMKILAKSDGLTVTPQDMEGFGKKAASNNSHLWIQGRKPGDFVELKVPAAGKQTLAIYATRSWDYGIVKFTVNGRPAAGDAGKGVDLWCGPQHQVKATGAIALGDFEAKDGGFTIRAEVVGGNEKSEGSKSFFGLDCVTLTPAK